MILNPCALRQRAVLSPLPVPFASLARVARLFPPPCRFPELLSYFRRSQTGTRWCFSHYSSFLLSFPLKLFCKSGFPRTRCLSPSRVGLTKIFACVGFFPPLFLSNAKKWSLQVSFLTLPSFDRLFFPNCRCRSGGF